MIHGKGKYRHLLKIAKSMVNVSMDREKSPSKTEIPMMEISSTAFLADKALSLGLMESSTLENSLTIASQAKAPTNGLMEVTMRVR